ncbi:hypothetical protein HanPSC8_Chr01g0023231 [Helianthus annuus]|nr:hypothetical protein HanPSC8_Chr01g0023231 [Helianthus annuus]
MIYLASILESYESLVAGKIGNPNMTKEDYDQIDPEEMELIDIRLCIASVIRRAQRFMEITGRQCLGGPTTTLGFDKSKVTCFKYKQKGYIKRECSNQNLDESVNPFNDDYYQKAIYHRTNEQPPKINRSQISEGSSKERKQALVVTQEDEGFNWNKYIPKEKVALVAEVRPSREERHARMRSSEVYDVFQEEKNTKRWDDERKCYLVPQGNPIVDPKMVDFEALVAAIPTAGEFYSKIKEDKNYEEKVERHIKRVINVSVEKKKSVEKIIDESQKMKDEILKKTTEKTKLADQTEVKTQTESTDSSNKVKSMGNNDEIGDEYEKTK